MPTLTPNYSLYKPLVNDPIDEDLWGGYLNENMDTIDAQMKTNADSVPTAINAMKALFVGMSAAFATDEAPDEWLEEDGSAVSRTTFSQLFGVIGTTWGEGDGSTTFNLPDSRGEFIRGWDNGRGIDVDRVFGEHQLDQMQRITGAQTGGLTFINGSGSVTGAFGVSTTSTSFTGAGGSNYQRLTFDSANSPNARTSATTDGETRPRNNTRLICIYTGVSTA